MTGEIVPASFSRRNGKASPAKFDPPPVQPDDEVRGLADLRELPQRLLADDRLVQEDVVEHGSQRVAGVRLASGYLDGLGDGDAQRARMVGMSSRIFLPDSSAPTATGARSRRRPPSSGAGTASGHRRPDLPDLALDVEERARRRPVPCPTAPPRSRSSAAGRRPSRCSRPGARRCSACASPPARRPRTCSRSARACRAPSPAGGPGRAARAATACRRRAPRRGCRRTGRR
jgi:hypothetical protein